MKTEAEIKEQIEKLNNAILKDTLYLEQTNGMNLTLENRIAIQREMEIRRAQERMLKWALSDW